MKRIENLRCYKCDKKQGGFVFHGDMIYCLYCYYEYINPYKHMVVE